MKNFWTRLTKFKVLQTTEYFAKIMIPVTVSERQENTVENAGHMTIF